MSKLKSYCKFRPSNTPADKGWLYGFIVGEALYEHDGSSGSVYLVVTTEVDPVSIGIHHQVKSFDIFTEETRKKYNPTVLNIEHVKGLRNANFGCHMMGSDLVRFDLTEEEEENKISYEEFEQLVADDAVRVEMLKDVYYPSLVPGQRLRVLPPTIAKTCDCEITYLIKDPDVLDASNCRGDFSFTCKALEKTDCADKAMDLVEGVDERIKLCELELKKVENISLNKEEREKERVLKHLLSQLHIVKKHLDLMFPDKTAKYFCFNAEQTINRITIKEIFLIS